MWLNGFSLNNGNILLWINLGGLFTGIILTSEFLYLSFVVYKTKSIEALGNMMYFISVGNATPLEFNDDGSEKLSQLFLYYRFMFSYIYLRGQSVLATDPLKSFPYRVESV